MKNILEKIDPCWTLFLDRDGVVNVEKTGKYVNRWEEFKFYSGVKDSFRIFNIVFGKILMVTNQRGVAKGITKTEDLRIIHENMIAAITDSGGRIDKVYVCTDLEGKNRKPEVGMGLQALKDFPRIDLNKSVMVGDKLSDMKFGRNLGVAVNVFLTTTSQTATNHPDIIDFTFTDLYEFAAVLPLS